MGSDVSRPEPEVAKRLLRDVDGACFKAAEAISHAHVLLLLTGAGFSADSGLAVYADVAKVDAYAERGLEYHDICHPRWLKEEPELFWGFWGQCYNDYRDTAPHAGYEILSRWARSRFKRTKTATDIKGRLLKGRQYDKVHSNLRPQYQAPYQVQDVAGAFFVFTSNVDAHHFDWFDACEIHECHGNTELYQCGSGNRTCPSGVWRAPLDFRFKVNKDTMLAPVTAEGAEALPAVAQQDASQADPAALERAAAPSEPQATTATPWDALAPSAAAPEASPPRVGRVDGSTRTTTLRYMPGDPEAAAAGFETNHPVCISCGEAARPAILMFDDGGCKQNPMQEQRWCDWVATVMAMAEQTRRTDQPLRVAILEIGAGGNVPTVRNQAQDKLTQFTTSGASVKLIRINPEFPLGDDTGDPDVKPPNAENLISIMARGLESLSKIDGALIATGSVMGGSGAQQQVGRRGSM